MNDTLYEQLVKDNPELFEKGEVSFDIGDGWYNIMAALLETITGDLTQAKNQLKTAIAYPRDDSGQYLVECEARIANALKKLPTILQVKEKFGGLRFYYRGGNEFIETAVTMAERMAYRTCQDCGRPGKSRNDGWIRVLCDQHASRENKSAIPKTGATTPSFDSDEL